MNYEVGTKSAYSDLKLDRVRRVLKEFGDPQDRLKIIHVAGTKGKGSTCAILFSVLKAAGYTVGLYTSPHLIDVRERIKIGFLNETSEARERLITREEFSLLIEELKPAVVREGLTYFEVLTVGAFIFFARKNVEFAVIETGMGGRLDATSVAHPLISGITSISLDHQQFLGNDLKLIAAEKGAIIKENSVAVTAEQDPEVWRILNQISREKKVPLYELGRDFVYDVIGQDLSGSVFDFKGIYTSYEGLKLSLPGQYQIANATLALGILELLNQYDTILPPMAVRRGLQNIFWPGRLQVASRHPLVILDGCQNFASAQALQKSLEMLVSPAHSFLVLGVSRDKDAEGICRVLCRNKDLVILTRADNQRAMDLEKLEASARDYTRSLIRADDVTEALQQAMARAGDDGLVLVAGSLYLVGDALKALRKLL